MHSADQIEEFITRFICDELNLPEEDVDADINFGAFGLGSMAGTRLIGQLEDRLALNLSATLVFEYPTISELAAMIASKTAHA